VNESAVEQSPARTTPRSRTTQLYDRRRDEVILDDVETTPTRPHKATEFTQVLFATLFMELRGGLEVGRHLVAKGGGGGAKLNALVRRFRLL